MKNSRLKLGIIVAIIGLVFGVWQIVKFDKEIDESFNNMIKEFPPLLIKDSVDSEVLEIHKKPNGYDPFGVNISIINNKKLTIYSIKCLTNSETNLEDVIKVGTKIQKAAGSNCLIVEYNDEEYHFVLDDELLNLK